MPSARVRRFRPQSQETPLSEAAIDKLRDLKKTNNINCMALDKHLQSILKRNSHVVGEMNDKAYANRKRLLKKKNRLEAQGRTVPQDEVEEHNYFQREVRGWTITLDLMTRERINDSVWVQDLPNAIEHVVRKSTAALHRSTQQSQFDNEDEQDLDTVDGTNRRDNGALLTQPDPADNPAALLRTAIHTKAEIWNCKSLADRYSENNDYIDFYRSVYHANHQGENAAPIPHASTWFATEEGREGFGAKAKSNELPPHRSRTGGPAERWISAMVKAIDMDDDVIAPLSVDADGDVDMNADSDPEIEVSAERVRITCPLTLKPYTHPYRSTKCPHAFEQQAIFEMLRSSTDRAPLTDTMSLELSQISSRPARLQRENELRPKMVKCPECSVGLTEKDLRPDPVLAKIVRRELERQRRVREFEERGEDEHGGYHEGDSSMMKTGRDVVDVDDESDDNDDDDDGLPIGTQRRTVVRVGSSPPRNARFVKRERMSTLSTPPGTAGRTPSQPRSVYRQGQFRINVPRPT